MILCMAPKIECYVDTAAFIAFLDRSHSNHDLFLRCFSCPPQLVTSALVVPEGNGWFLLTLAGSRVLFFIFDISLASCFPASESELAAKLCGYLSRQLRNGRAMELPGREPTSRFS